MLCNKLQQIRQLKTTSVYPITVILIRSPVRDKISQPKIKVSASLIYYLETLGKKLCTSLFKLLAEFILVPLVATQQGHPQLLEATCIPWLVPLF